MDNFIVHAANTHIKGHSVNPKKLGSKQKKKGRNPEERSSPGKGELAKILCHRKHVVLSSQDKFQSVS
jgi:hypothetical protein